jgi:hypothetical protein
MTYLGRGLPEAWELEGERFLNSILSRVSARRRIAILLTVGMVTAIEISSRLPINRSSRTTSARRYWPCWLESR